MKCKVNGKLLKEKIESVLLKGKWNNGGSSKNTILCPSVIISVQNENICKLSNGNPSTYVSNTLELIELEDCETGRVSVDSEILLKYLPKEDCILQLVNNIFQLVSERKTVRIPILERHENNDSILFVEKNLNIERNINTEVTVSARTTLNTRVKVSTDELVNALSDCEAVGTSVFQLDYDGEHLNVSSSNGTELVMVKIEPMESVGEKATMEFSAPVHKYLEGRATILSFEDETPLALLSGNLKVLRAPRIEH
tara:strand:+ start:541 stop:1302 length:762 start_codon:yes stop_codon:yes gene_type:complete